MGIVKFFWYKHPKTGEMFSDQRMEGYEDKPFVHKGVVCELIRDYAPPIKESKSLGVRQMFKDGQREVFEADPQYVKKMNPKNIRFQDGHIERYDPTKHC